MNLAVIEHQKQNQLTLDSREVAEMVEKEHKILMRDIRTYIEYMGTKMNPSNFFIVSTYKDAYGREQPCYLVTRKGCDMIANKMTGEKGVIFTATYIDRFYEMEKALMQVPLSIEDMIIMQANSVKELKNKVDQVEINSEFAKEQALSAHQRIDAMDNTDIIGDLRQRLVRKVNKYAERNGLTYGTGWNDFRQAYNTAFRTNIALKKKNYMESHGIKKMTYPEYLETAGYIADALRVADKMLNKQQVCI